MPFSLHSLYPHLFSRAYINFKNPEDILLFRDRFDGYVFIDNKGTSCLLLTHFNFIVTASLLAHRATLSCYVKCK